MYLYEIVSLAFQPCLYLLSGARVNAKDSKWLTPLHRAVASCSEVFFKFCFHCSMNLLINDLYGAIMSSSCSCWMNVGSLLNQCADVQMSLQL